MKNALVLTVMLVGMIAVSIICNQPAIKAQTHNDITINFDGSITPSTAPIKQAGNVYTLNSNFDGSLLIERNNIIFDGNGHNVKGYLSIGYGNAKAYGNGKITVGLSYTLNVTVANFTITDSVSMDSGYGIYLSSTSNVSIINNTIRGVGNGILSLDEPTAGIYVEGGGSNIIAGNNLTQNYNGISFLESENNLITENNITYSSNPYKSGYGIMFLGASNNTIYHNNFINNNAQVHDDDFNSPFSVNIWSNSFLDSGNYWSDYVSRYSNAKEISNSGVGDVPYVIDDQNKDQYPLMKPFTTSTYLLQTPPAVFLESPLNQTYNESSVSLVFLFDKEVNWTGYSLDGKSNVTVTGNGTLANLINGLHTITVYANDTFGNMGVSQTVNFSIAVPTIVKLEPFPIVLIATSVGVAALVIAVGLIVHFKKHHR